MSDEANAAPVDTGQAAALAETSWTSVLSEENQGYVENKGFQDADALATSYKNLESLRGVPAERLMTLPDDMSNRDAMLPVYAKLGHPESVEGYKRVLDDSFNVDMYNSLAGQAHELGLGDAQFSGLQSVFAEQMVTIQAQQEDAAVASFDAWKADNQEGFNNAARVLAEAGMQESEVTSVLAGDKTALYDFLGKVGGRTAESTVITGDAPSGFTMSASAAKTAIDTLRGDEAFMKVYLHASPSVRQPAIDRMSKLQQIVAG